MAVGTEFDFEVGNGWRLKQRGRLANISGTFNSPFPAQVGAADAIATDLAGAGYTLSYANGANAGTPLTSTQISNLNGNGLLMRIHSFDVEMNNLNNFTNDIFLTKEVGNAFAHPIGKTIPVGDGHGPKNAAVQGIVDPIHIAVQRLPRVTRIGVGDTGAPLQDKQYDEN
jgi:hypothetical protein